MFVDARKWRVHQIDKKKKSDKSSKDISNDKIGQGLHYKIRSSYIYVYIYVINVQTVSFVLRGF